MVLKELVLSMMQKKKGKCTALCILYNQNLTQFCSHLVTIVCTHKVFPDVVTHAVSLSVSVQMNLHLKKCNTM